MVDGHRDTAGHARRRPRRFGWRAYALPLLAGISLVALVVAVQSPPGADSTDASPSPTAAPPSPAVASSASAAPSTAPVDPAAPTPGYPQLGDGSLSTVGGTGAVLGGGGELTTFDVVVEGGLGLDGAQFASQVEQILADPRGWTAGGRRSFQRTGDGHAAVHVMLVSPQRVESFCPGYGTGGYTSCRFQDRVVINLARWSTGVPQYTGHLWDYRQYVITHEVGHFLGYEHVECPGSGLKAPVMMQQTLGLDGCVMNAWPYPNSPADDPSAPA